MSDNRASIPLPASTPAPSATIPKSGTFILGDEEYKIHTFKMGLVRQFCDLLDERLKLFQSGAESGTGVGLGPIFESNIRFIAAALGKEVDELENIRATLPQTGLAVDVILEVAGLRVLGEQKPVETENLSHYDSSL